MSTTSQLFRFKIELADISRSTYESMDFRIAQHPSESIPYLLTRILAYALNLQEGLAFSPLGLGNPDEPCLRIPNLYGGDLLWIEIGNPNPKKLHKASKTANTVKVYTYKNPELLIQDLKQHPIHRAQDLEIFAFSSDFLENLSSLLSRESRWSITHNDGSLIVSTTTHTVQGDIVAYRL
jgi:uncharacterized protein YaeQ